MTTKKLYALRGIDREIKHVRERIRAAEACATSTVGSLRAAPSGGTKTTDKVGDGAAEIAYLRGMLQCAERKKAARDAYIDGIADAVTRDAMRMVYIDGKSWRAAAEELDMTESGLRKRVKRKAKQKSDG